MFMAGFLSLGQTVGIDGRNMDSALGTLGNGQAHSGARPHQDPNVQGPMVG